MITKSAALVDHENSTLTNPCIGKTGCIFDTKRNETRFTDTNEEANEQHCISPQLYMMALIVAAAAATFANTMKELLTDKWRYYIFDKPGDKNLIKYMLSGADTGAGVTRVPTEKWTICNFRVFF